MALALKSLPTPALDLPLCLLSPLPLIVTSTRFAVQFDSVNKAMDKKLDDMSTALISRFSLMLAQFQSRINQPFLSGGSAVPGYSGCQTEPPSLQTPVCTKSRTGLWFQEGEEDAVPHEPGLAQESSSTARVTIYYRVKGEPKNFLSNHGFFFISSM